MSYLLLTPIQTTQKRKSMMFLFALIQNANMTRGTIVSSGENIILNSSSMNILHSVVKYNCPEIWLGLLLIRTLFSWVKHNWSDLLWQTTVNLVTGLLWVHTSRMLSWFLNEAYIGRHFCSLHVDLIWTIFWLCCKTDQDISRFFFFIYLCQYVK